MCTSQTPKERAVTRNLRQIVKFEAKPNPKAQSLTTVTRGFERLAFSKLISRLGFEDVIVRCKAVSGLSELLYSSTGYVQCLSSGVMAPLTALLQDEDNDVRYRVAKLFSQITARELGCKTMIQEGAFGVLVTVLTDKLNEIRDASYQALLNACRFQCSLECLVSMGTALKHILNLAMEEEMERSLMGLKLLAACAGMRRNEAALFQLIDGAGALFSLTKMLQNAHNWKIQEYSTRLINLLAVRKDAKVVLVREGTVAYLLDLLAQSRLETDIAALSSLGNITVANEGKKAVLKCNAIPLLLDKLSSKDDNVVRHATACIMNMVEDPEARRVTGEHGDTEVLRKLYASAYGKKIPKM